MCAGAFQDNEHEPKVARKSNVPQTAVVALVTLAAVGLLGTLLAYWTWVWFAPGREPGALLSTVHPQHLESAFSLFGGAPEAPAVAAQSESPITLLGVVAGDPPYPSYAVLRLDVNKTVVKRDGEEIRPGVRLARVDADQVVIERNGVRERLPLPRNSGSAKQ
ncbi:MAG: type II secretion system protein N [Burkholderiales bacterium]